MKGMGEKKKERGNVRKEDTEEGGKDKEGQQEMQRKQNIQYRRAKKTPAIMSQVETEKLRDTYRWKTRIPASYLNNKEEWELTLAHGGEWGITREILKNKRKCRLNEN